MNVGQSSGPNEKSLEVAPAMEKVQVRVHGSSESPTLIYLPGLHGNWCLVGGFRRAMGDRVRFVEITYPSTIHWTLEEHAVAVEKELRDFGVSGGWFIAESFSSQVAWTILSRNSFPMYGLVLAGGFVQHPFRWGARLAQKWCDDISFALLRRILFGYARISRFRFRRSPETFQEIQEFVDKLTPRELEAAKHRLHLINQSDLCSAARDAKIPIYALTGLLDPIVPWFWVRRWMKRNCRSLQEYRIIWHADHNVLGTASKKSADSVWRWMSS